MAPLAVYNVSGTEKQETEEGEGTKMEERIEKHTMSSGQDIKKETNTPLQDFKGSADCMEYTRAHTQCHHAVCFAIPFHRSSHSWNNQNTRMRSATNSIFPLKDFFAFTATGPSCEGIKSPLRPTSHFQEDFFLQGHIHISYRGLHIITLMSVSHVGQS